MILLVIGAGGAFKGVLVEGGTSDYIKNLTDDWPVSPIFLAWLIAVILRVARHQGAHHVHHGARGARARRCAGGRGEPGHPRPVTGHAG